MSNTLTIKNDKISEILQFLLSQQRLTVTELSRRIKIPQPTIQRITAGIHTRPHKRTLASLAKFFNVTIDQLCGYENLPGFRNVPIINKAPLLTLSQAYLWPKIDKKAEEHVVLDNNDSNVFAIKMPDASMDPLIPEESTLIIDPKREPNYGNFVLVTLSNTSTLLVRQLIIDGKNKYIKPVSSDFQGKSLYMLNEYDSIRGVIIEVRFKL